MTPKNRRIFFFFTLFLLGGYLIVANALYRYTHEYALDQNKKKLDQLLLNQRALHLYIEDQLKPVIYGLKEEKKLYHGYFDPKLLSFTYIARNIHYELNRLRDEHNSTRIYYKLATDNPRNPLNRADSQELDVLNRFRKDRSMQEYSRLLEENGKPYIYYAMPIEPNKPSCLKCHSTPENAPAELIKRYGNTGGFGEKVGDIRAMISLKMPFEDELAETNRIFFLIMGIFTLFILILFGVVWYFIRRLDRSQQQIEEKNRHLCTLTVHDGLTGTYNPRSFVADLAVRLEDPALFLIIFDIDYFKAINDTHGHQSGDSVLKELATLVRSHLREEDRLYRVGGEEFAVLTQNPSQLETERLVGRLLEVVGEYDFKIGEAVHISAGIAGRTDGETAQSLYRRADNALYRAKESGRNRYAVG